MFLKKLSKSFVYEIGRILKLYTCSLIENSVIAFEIILIYIITTHLQNITTDKSHY